MIEDKLTRWQRLRPYLERWVPLLTAFWAGMITLALLIACLPWFRDTPHVSGSWLTPWTWPHMESLAAWIQAIGSVAAIYFAGRSAERLFDRHRTHDLARDADAQKREFEQNRYRVMEIANDLRNMLVFLDARNDFNRGALGQRVLTEDLLQSRVIIPDRIIDLSKAAKAHLDAFGHPLAEMLVGLSGDMEFWNRQAPGFLGDERTLQETVEDLKVITELTPELFQAIRQGLLPFVPRPAAALARQQAQRNA